MSAARIRAVEVIDNEDDPAEDREPDVTDADEEEENERDSFDM